MFVLYMFIAVCVGQNASIRVGYAHKDPNSVICVGDPIFVRGDFLTPCNDTKPSSCFWDGTFMSSIQICSKTELMYKYLLAVTFFWFGDANCTDARN